MYFLLLLLDYINISGKM